MAENQLNVLQSENDQLYLLEFQDPDNDNRIQLAVSKEIYCNINNGDAELIQSLFTKYLGISKGRIIYQGITVGNENEVEKKPYEPVTQRNENEVGKKPNEPVATKNENDMEKKPNEPVTQTSLPLEHSITWERKYCKQLITLYEERNEKFMDPAIKKSLIWKDISDEMGEQFTPTKCENKWKALLKKYKDIKDNNKKTGAERKYFPHFEEMDTFLRFRPDINPACTAGNNVPNCEEEGKRKTKTVEETVVKKKKTENKDTVEGSISKCVEMIGKLVEQQSRNEERRLNILEKLVDNINKK